MDADRILEQFTIPDPCPMNWDDMDGDARTRYCTACGEHVHDLTAVTAEEAAGTIRHQGAQVCGRLYARPDGTLTSLAGEISAPSSRPTPMQFTIRSIMAVIAGVAAMLGFARLFADNATRPAPPPSPLNTLIMGKMAPSSQFERKPTPGPSNANPGTPKSCAESDRAP
jgi:hypothetical protein